MAEACRIGNRQFNEGNLAFHQDENFCLFSVLCVFISLVTILADLTTDIIVFAEYCKDGYAYWALVTLIFILTPNILINIFSLRWLVIDQKSNLKHWITHCCLVGLLERYILFIQKVFSCPSLETIKTQKLISLRNDLSLLHFLYIFTGTVPQIILQTYAIITLEENYYTKVFALTASNASVVWGCATYIYSLMAFSGDTFQCTSFLLKLVWHFGMLAARISGILLFTVIFGIWTLLPLGLHWSAMTFWIVVQHTTFCPNKLEETLYNVVMGFVYCFCFINLRGGHTRYRLLMFYTLMITQNFGSLFLFVLLSDFDRQRKSWSIASSVCIIMGTVIGMYGMIMYYRYYHSKGPIPWRSTNYDIELNNKISSQKGLKHVRSFKSTQKDSNADGTQKENAEPLPHSVTENADKKFLLDHWIARSGTPTFTSAPIGNNSVNVSSIEFYTAENTPQLANMPVKNNKKLTICSPTELTLKLSSLENLESSIDEITTSNLNVQKRRGICSSDELRDNLNDMTLEDCNITTVGFMKSLNTDSGQGIDSSTKKTSSDSIDMDLDLSFSDINSSDINTFNENIVQKLCLSALKNIKVGNQDADIENIQRIALDILKEMYTKKDKNKNSNSTELLSKKQRDLDTPTESLSVHDYENICAVNIAREAWGLRSWNGYLDIENWLHDGSVVRDRRRDTLTSASTEISSCLSQEFKNAILSAPSFPLKSHTYSNVFIKFDKSNQEDYSDSVSCELSDDIFLAKPCIIDNGKDPNHLEPIMEEIDDLDIDLSKSKRLNSKSSLVATIDEIRKATTNRSPRNLYNRRELWESPQLDAPANINNSLKRALWKEPSKFDASNIMRSIPEKENNLFVHESKFQVTNSENTREICPPYLPDTQFTMTYSKNSKRRQKSNVNNLKNQYKKTNSKPEQHLQDLSNKDIDLLWQLVTENSLPGSSTEDISSSRLSSSLQSLLHREASTSFQNTSTSSTSKISNLKKSIKCKPRRKFSMLRERFEPKIYLNSDEEILCQHTDSTHNNLYSHFASTNNLLDIGNKSNVSSQPRRNTETPSGNDKKSNRPTTSDSIISKSIKEKRSLFMKQVLSPPKFNTKLRHKV